MEGKLRGDGLAGYEKCLATGEPHAVCDPCGDKVNTCMCSMGRWVRDVVNGLWDEKG